MYHNLSPEYLTNLIPERPTGHRQTRQSDQIPSILCHSNSYFNSFLPCTIRNWNQLPLEIRNDPSPSHFKTLINFDLTKTPQHYFVGTRLNKSYTQDFSKVLYTRNCR